MNNTIPLHDNPHAATQRLLPWYVNGTLDEAERRVVATHLESCADCRSELALERQLETDIAVQHPDVDQGWARMREQLVASTVAPAKVAWFRRRVPLGGALAAQAMAATVLLGLLIAPQFRAAAPADYRALGTAPSATKGNMIVMFAEDARERDMRSAIAGIDARLVDGPTVAGAYLLQVPENQRANALRKLHADASVSLAEPIDPGTTN